MASFVCLIVKDNLVVQLSNIIQVTKKYIRTPNMQHEQAVERLLDIKTLLCCLMADMIASPMTGCLHLPNPVFYVDDGTRQASLHRQLSLAVSEQAYKSKALSH